MDRVINTIELLARYPAHLLAVLTILLCISASRVLGRRFESELERALAQYSSQINWARIETFVLMVYITSVTAAVLWCCFATHLPPPLPRLDINYPLGPVVFRYYGYLMAFTATLLAIFPLVFRYSSPLFPQLSRVARRVMFLGVVGASAYIAYAAVFDPTSALAYAPPTGGFEIALWWYCFVPMLTPGFGLVLFLLLFGLLWMWRASGQIPG